ncbi:type II 3-dehydroquinate dehydratase [Ornithinibacillus sp. L9]|uniref:3-dehydroquinate dehydratase n=1 Tax=Ornithinibacillus caprae TaxID=2678566 RepID=A0A6N8FCR8_9BACI|nr:type II 3-dehydroquinate dehydratase [Ornithinibacillus caprae]MUK87155.1 type II 3-dehydroquinate dehydratase [Ornithinibacillus caprae]
MKRLLLLNGPNINILGKRENEVYGDFTLSDIETEIRELVEKFGYQLDSKQSNHEGELVDILQGVDGTYEGVIFNPAAYTHTSIALHDVIKAISTPVVEVHISNIHSRESFRHQSLLASVCYGQIVGFGKQSYRLAALALLPEQ